MLHCQNRFKSDQAMISSSLQVQAEEESPLLTNRHQDYRMTRRSILIGATPSLICAPAIVRATRLMPVRGLPVHILNPMGEFYRRCFYRSLDSDLKAGRSMSAGIDGKIVSAAEACRMVAYARTQGWLPLWRESHSIRSSTRPSCSADEKASRRARTVRQILQIVQAKGIRTRTCIATISVAA